MQSLSYSRSVVATGTGVGSIKVAAEGCAPLGREGDEFQSELEDHWSPELLLLAAAARCYILAFRSVSYVSKLPWQHVECTVTGQINRADGVVRFTRIATYVKLTVHDPASEDLCRRVVRKTERICLIANSLRAERDLGVDIVCTSTTRS
jgi:organic hydroperoxide reductase OsmC/OhrA